MKKISRVVLAALGAFSLFFASCASTSVERVSADTVVDLDGFWNDTDVKLVCDSLIKECIQSPKIAQFEEKNGRAPVVIVNRFKNKSDEHIDTTIISKKMENAIINSGVMEFVADKTEREALREEKLDQDDYASDETKKSIGNEEAADFMLSGEVTTIVQSANNTSVRTYTVTVQLLDIETNRKVWSGENSEIKKIIKKAKHKL